MHPGFSLCWSCDKAGTGYPAAEIANTSSRWSDQLPMNPAPRSAFPRLILSFKWERDKKKHILDQWAAELHVLSTALPALQLSLINCRWV